MTLQSADGADFVIDRLDLSRHPLVEAVPIAVARPRTFDRCPICLDQNPVSREHVPPKSIGGDVMTHTCRRCNNRAGSVLERALLDWWEDALVSVRLSHEEVLGARRVPRILLRQTRGGEPVFFCDDGLFDPAIAGKFLPGNRVTMSFQRPDPHRYRLAALKSAYLGACLLLGEIPESPDADEIRTEILAARDLGPRKRPNISERTARLQLSRSQGPAVPGEVALMETQSLSGQPGMAISLARTLLVSWPLNGWFLGLNDDGKVLSTCRTSA